MEETVKFINKELSGKKVILGCSYGPDSMFLLNLLDKLKIEVICACVNHNIRDKSIIEFKKLKDYCKKRKITFEGLTLKKNKKGEDYYRNIRLDFFRELAQKYQTKYIATAHHADDLIETILMRLTRGSNLNGYGGFKPIYEEKGYIYIKPLIFLTKEEILHLNEKYDIPYMIDESNNTDIYCRNRFRKNVLPFLKSENKYVHKRFLEFSREINNANEYIKNKVSDSLKNMFYNNTLDLNIFFEEDEYIQTKILENIVRNLYGDNIGLIKRKHIDKIKSLLKNTNNFQYDLPKGWTVTREYDKLLFGSSNIDETYDLVLSDNIELTFGTIRKVNNSDKSDNNVLRLKSSDISLPLHVRTRKEGDKMIVKNSTFEKKLKKIFIDMKVPKRIRDSYPIVTDNNGMIIWIPGIVKGNLDVDKNQKYDIIFEYERKGEIYEKTKECN